VIEQSPSSEGRENPSPILRFSAAMRVANETPPEDFDTPESAEMPEMFGPDEAPGTSEGFAVSEAAEIPEAAETPEAVGTTEMPAAAESSDEAVSLSRRYSEIEAWIEKLAERFDQLEFVIVEQFEPGMSQPGERPSGNLRERLDRIEVTLAQLSQEPAEALPAAVDGGSGAAALAAATGIEDRLNAIASRLADVVDAEMRRSAAADAAEDRLRTLEGAVEAMSTGADASRMAVLDAIERVSQRPPPAPDMTLQHRSFAGFATALQTTLDRFETSVGAILERLDGVTERVGALEAGLSRLEDTAVSQTVAEPPTSGLDLSLAALSDRICALAEVLGTRQQPADLQDITVVSARLEQLGALLSAALEEAGKSNSDSLDESLRDLRMAIAEIAAENRRLRIA
jgi:hypothetical protein